jgi:hypothetical protein
MADIVTATGAKLFIAPSQATKPADATAFAALTWTEIKFISNLGEYGDEAAEITFPVLGDARVLKAKGARDSGAMTVNVAHVVGDPGQAALVAAEKTANNYPFKVTMPNRLTPGGTDEINYLWGLVRSRRLNVGANDNVLQKNFAISMNAEPLEVAAT